MRRQRSDKVFEALQAFQQRVGQTQDRCPKRPTRRCWYTGYPRERARCAWCGKRRDE